jgi:hypothetical protein
VDSHPSWNPYLVLNILPRHSFDIIEIYMWRLKEFRRCIVIINIMFRWTDPRYSSNNSGNDFEYFVQLFSMGKTGFQPLPFLSVLILAILDSIDRLANSTFEITSLNLLLFSFHAISEITFIRPIDELDNLSIRSTILECQG